MVLHVARCADRFVVLHDVDFSSQNTVTVKAAEVLQVPVLPLGLSVFVTEDELENTHKHTHTYSHIFTYCLKFKILNTVKYG